MPTPSPLRVLSSPVVPTADPRRFLTGDLVREGAARYPQTLVVWHPTPHAGVG